MQRHAAKKAAATKKPTTTTQKRTLTTKRQQRPRATPVHKSSQRQNATVITPATPAKRIMCKASSKLGVGLVGLPNIGKSLIFNALTEQNVPSENFPFCTIDPSTAVVPVSDDRLHTLADISRSQKILNSVLNITDIAGLVKGASDGKGLGNEFLSNIASVDAIFHLVRLFPQPKNRDVIHVEGSIDPIRDMDIISNELIAKDKKTLSQTLQKLQKQSTKASLDPFIVTQFAAVKKAMELLEAQQDVREGLYTQAEADALVPLGLLSAKPIIYILNCSTEEYLSQYSPTLKATREWIKQRSPGSSSLLFSGDWEADLTLTPKEDQPEYVKDMTSEYPLHPDHQPLIEYGDLVEPNYNQQQAMKLVEKSKSMIPAMVSNAYTSLNLIQYFTTGPMETRSWTIPRGALAPEAAGAIHTDLMKTFAAAEVISFPDMAEVRDEDVLKKQGKVKVQGKQYVVQDGDIIVFKTGAGKK